MEWFCLSCGTVGQSQPRRIIGLGLELLAWAVGLLLALRFGLWVLLGPLALSIVRAFAIRQTCMRCGSRQIVPSDTPAAIAMRASLKRQAQPADDQ